MTSLEANRVLPAPAETSRGSRRYLEQYAALLVSNRHLRVAILCITMLSLGLLVLNLKTVQTLRNFKTAGHPHQRSRRAEAVTYDSLAYQPRDAEMKYFLIQFVTKHYGRMRATVP